MISLGALAPMAAASGCVSLALIAAEPVGSPIEFRFIVGDQSVVPPQVLPAGTQLTVTLTTLADSTRTLTTTGGPTVAQPWGAPANTPITGSSTQWQLVVPVQMAAGLRTAFFVDPGTTRFILRVDIVLPDGCGNQTVCFSTPTPAGYLGNTCGFGS